MATYTIEWLHRTESIGSEPAQGTDSTAIVHAARARASEVGNQNPSKEPDSFRIMDDSGAEIGAYSVSEKAFDGTS